MAAAGFPRWVNVAVAGVALLLVSPLLAGTAILVRFSSPGPILFRQQRVGLGGRLFWMLKFRTMLVGSGGPLVTSRDDNRITPVGRYLRRLKLDELPELWNVARGEMDLVGPRPEVPSLVDHSHPLWKQVLSVRPGLTDPVTITLRNEEELMASVPGERDNFYRNVLQPYKLRRYCDYLRTRSWRSDLKTILLTVLAVFRPAMFPPPSLAELMREAPPWSGDGEAARVPHA